MTPAGKRKREALEIAQRISDEFVSRTIEGSDKYGNNYEVELAYEALLQLGLHQDVVENYLRAEGMLNPSFAKNWIYQLFHDIAYPWFETTHQLPEFTAAYRQITDQWMNEAVRRDSGTITYYGPQKYLGSLIDMLQAYMIRLCRTAKLTGDRAYAEAAVNQYRLYRIELRNKASGCFHQGKGWFENDGLSPLPWSRGQGWIVHGLIHCLPLLKIYPDLHDELHVYFVELATDLVRWQTPSGFWNQLIDHPQDSYPDTSGTALIFEALQLGVQYGYLEEAVFGEPAKKAWNILKQQVDEHGVVDQACKGPGTIFEIGPWLNTLAPKGEPHGIFSMLFACQAILFDPDKI